MIATAFLFVMQGVAAAPDTVPVAAPVTLAPPAVSIAPARPVQGSLIMVRARAADGDTLPLTLSGTFAGEALHFFRDTAGYAAYAGIPVEAHGTMELTLAFSRDGAPGDSMVVPVPVTSAKFGTEHLSVDPRFTRPPDSALAARIASESEAIRNAWLETHTTPKLWTGAFQRPRPGRVTSVFGTGREFNGVIQSRHLGADFAGAVGSTIRAANRGVVALVGDHYYSGNIVIVNHGGGIATAYLHMSKVLVSVGDTVSRGHLLGLVGSTGRVTGPHLHWIAKYGSISVNPMSLLSLTAPPRPERPRRAPAPARTGSPTSQASN